MKRFDAGAAGSVLVGPEKVLVEGADDGIGYDEPHVRMTAFAGTGFDPDNPQHVVGSDGLRLAIGIQQCRDARDYGRADEIREWAAPWFIVKCGKDFTTVIPN